MRAPDFDLVLSGVGPAEELGHLGLHRGLDDQSGSRRATSSRTATRSRSAANRASISVRMRSAGDALRACRAAALPAGVPAWPQPSTDSLWSPAWRAPLPTAARPILTRGSQDRH